VGAAHSRRHRDNDGRAFLQGSYWNELAIQSDLHVGALWALVHFLLI